MTPPPVTVICATCNARDAVRLTFASLFRYHAPGSVLVYVADNGSTDGALDELRAFPSVQAVTLEQRLALLAADAHTDVTSANRSAVAEHGATLDWLMARVDTTFTLVLDSDVEFRGPDVIAELVAFADRYALDAVGEFEPGWYGYRPRLAPYLLLLRTETVRNLHTSFRGFTEIADPAEYARWAAGAHRYEVPPEEFATYRTMRCYPTAARLFERLTEERLAWKEIPDGLAERVRHFGHMSWGPLADEHGGSPRSRVATTSSAAAVTAALRAY